MYRLRGMGTIDLPEWVRTVRATLLPSSGLLLVEFSDTPALFLPDGELWHNPQTKPAPLVDQIVRSCSAVELLCLLNGLSTPVEPETFFGRLWARLRNWWAA